MCYKREEFRYHCIFNSIFIVMSLNYIRDYEQSSLIAWQGCSLSGGRNAIKGERERQWRHPPGSEFVKPGDSESFGSFSVEYSYDFLRVRPSLRASVHRKWILKFHQFSPLLRPFPSQCSEAPFRIYSIQPNSGDSFVNSFRNEMMCAAPRAAKISTAAVAAERQLHCGHQRQTDTCPGNDIQKWCRGTY